MTLLDRSDDTLDSTEIHAANVIHAHEIIPISVITLTKNEENYIERCVKSANWADEHLILDCGSDDRTCEIAESFGARVHVQEWLGWSQQRNKAIELAKHDWVFFLEADEIISTTLANAIKTAMLNDPDPLDGYAVNRQDDFCGVLLPNMRRPSKNKNFFRLFNRKHSSYDPAMKVHEEVRVPGRSIMLPGVLLHWRGSKMDEHINVLNRYATIEAEVLYEQGQRANELTIFIRPILRFLWCYIARSGYRMGTQGLLNAMTRAIAEYVRYAKLWELEQGPETIHPPEKLYDR